MAVNARLVDDLITTITDTVAMTPDSVERMILLQSLIREWERVLYPLRDQTAYECRQRYTKKELVAMTGLAHDRFTYWSTQYRHRTGAPTIGRVDRRRLNEAIDLT
jgi:hypothetical protein